MPKAKVIETQVKISGLMDKSVQAAVQNVGKKFEGLNKQFAAFEKVALGAAAALTGAFAGAAGFAAKKLLDLSSEFQEVENTIRIGTGATGESLKELEASFDNLYNTLPLSKDMVAGAVADINTLTGMTGKELEEFAHRALDAADMLGEDAKKLYTEAAQSMNAFSVSTGDMAGMLDYVWKVSQSTGVGMSDLMQTAKANEATFKQLGYSYEESVALIGQMEKAGFETSAAMSALKKAISTMSKGGVKDFSKGMQNAFENIKNAKDATEATELAIEAFGARAGSTMALGIRNGTISVEEFVKTLQASDETIGKAGEETDTFKDKWTESWHKIETSFRPATETINEALKDFLPIMDDLAARAVPYVQEAVEILNGYLKEGADAFKEWATNLDFEEMKARVGELIEKFKDMIQWVRDNKDMLFATAKAIGGVYLAIKGLQAGIAIWNGITKAVKFYKDVVTICKAAHAAFTAAQVGSKIAMAASTVATWAQVAATWALNGAIAILTSPITLVIAAIAAVIAAVWLLYKNWDSITAWCSEKWKAFVAAFKAGWDNVSAWFAGIIDKFAPVIDTIKGLFTGAWEGIKSAFMTVFEALPAILKAPINGIISIINGAINAINGIGFTIPDWVPLLGGKEFSIDIPNLPMLASGGWTAGPSIAGEAGTELVTSFDPAHRAENQRNLATAAEMLGMFAAPKSEASRNVEINLGGINFQPVLKETQGGDTLARLRACLPELVDLITDAIQERTAHIYGN